MDQPLTDKEAFIEENKTTINDNDLSDVPKPQDSCKYCFGRGYEHWNFKTGEPSVCRCIQNRLGKVTDPRKLLTYGELKMMMASKQVIQEVANDKYDSVTKN